jgi:hypothetical protein
MLTLDYIQDPGHGWIAADLPMLRRLGIAGTISTYSYRDGDLCWLEDDCDAPRFIAALGKAGIRYRIVETHTRGDAWIRRLPRFEVAA